MHSKSRDPLSTPSLPHQKVAPSPQCPNVPLRIALAAVPPSYKLYLELEAAGKVQETISHLYDVGRDTNWVVP